MSIQRRLENILSETDNIEIVLVLVANLSSKSMKFNKCTEE